jgi:putative CocE/NonD family hydrolase
MIRAISLAAALAATTAVIGCEMRPPAAGASTPASEAAPDTLPSTVAVSKNVMVTMRDGVKLATDVFLPARDRVAIPGRYPTIFARTPYSKEGRDAAAAYFTSHGYAVVTQDTRGRFKSEGTWNFLTSDDEDGVDACEWIGKQPWSDGKIGMLGGSYEGGTQHALALGGCRNLTTIVPLDAVANPGYHGVRYAGAFELRIFNWIFLIGAPMGSHAVRDSAKRVALEAMSQVRLAYLDSLPLRQGSTPLRLAPEYESWLVEAMKHGGNDEFWHWLDVVDDVAKYQDLPVYLVGGWYDSWAGSTGANYSALSKAKKGPIYLIMGPWVHGGQGDSTHGQVNFGSAAAIPDVLAWHREWFDHWLKGTDNSVGKSGVFDSPVRIFVMGTGDGHRDPEGRLFHGGEWRSEREWPLSRARPTRYYLRPGRSLGTEAPAGAPGDTSSRATYVFDPENPVPTIGGNISSSPGMMENGGFDQRGNARVWNLKDPIPLATRKDVIVFQSEPLGRDVEVTGPIDVTLWASSDARDTDFTAKLVDVYPQSADWPEGFALNLEDGIVRARFRDAFPERYHDGGATEKLMTPGTPYRFTIRMYPTSNVFKRGHRIRLDVSSSNYPRFDVNPNTGEPLGGHTRMQKATNTILFDREHQSYVTLPVVPR